jgi:hypothetical protein
MPVSVLPLQRTPPPGKEYSKGGEGGGGQRAPGAAALMDTARGGGGNGNGELPISVVLMLNLAAVKGTYVSLLSLLLLFDIRIILRWIWLL